MGSTNMKPLSLMDEAAGRRSRSALVAMAAFWIGAFKFLFSGAIISIKTVGISVNFGTTDALLLGAFMIPCFGLYWGRRATDAYVRVKDAGRPKRPHPDEPEDPGIPGLDPLLR